MARILLIMSMIGSLFMAANVAAETRIKCASPPAPKIQDFRLSVAHL